MIDVTKQYGYSRFEGELPWHRINHELRTLSFKLPDHIGITVPFVYNPLHSPEENEEVIREKISGFDRYLPKEYVDDYKKKFLLTLNNIND